MNPSDIQIVTDKGLPILIATGIFVAVKLIRSQTAQSILALISPKLVWANWPKPVALLAIVGSTAAGALATALLQGTPIASALTTAMVAAVSAMGIDAAHGAIAEPSSTTKAAQEAASIKVPFPSNNPKP